MKKGYLLMFVALLTLLITQSIFAQQGIAKLWEGTLSSGMGGKLKVILNITQDKDGKLLATVDSPDQGAKGIPVDSIVLDGSKINLAINSVGGEYKGKVKEDYTQIDGEWKQGGQTIPLILKPVGAEVKDDKEFFSLWQGKLNTGGINLRIVFRFFKVGSDSIGAFLDSPDQGAKDFPATKVYYGNDSVYVEVGVVKGFYTGKFNSDKTKAEGKWNQGGMSFPLIIEKVDKVESVKHPQEPIRPFPYNEEEVTFENKDAGITLAGTLTYPKEGTNFPAVVLVTGSGPQNRDEELLGLKPFLVWSDYLTRNGIAVLRYDDRGIGKSTGNYNTATTFDLSTDAVAAVNYLKTRKEINSKEIGIAGHSEGGMIAPIAANKCKDVAFIVLAAGTAVPGDEIILLQSQLISAKEGIPEAKIKEGYETNKKAFNAIKSAKDSLEASKKLDALYNEMYAALPDSEKSKPDYSKENVDRMKNSLLNKWFIQFLKYDPRTELVKLHIPVLAMFGELDLQVPPSQNKGEMEKALKKSKTKYEVVVFPGLNHVFQECKTGSPSEYAQIEQIASPKMLEFMTDWIKKTTK